MKFLRSVPKEIFNFLRLWDDPWIIFFLFTFSNILLAYFQFSLEINLFIGLFGLFIPMIFRLSTQKKASDWETPPYELDFFKTPSWWVWGIVFLVAFFLRFFQLGTLFHFRLPDEVINALYAVQLNKQWSWNLFFHWSKLPPFYIWLLALLFKWTNASWTTIVEGLPAFLSFMAVPLFFISIRRLVSPSFAFTFTVACSTQFWPCFVGRFSHQAILMLVWEAIAFALLATWQTVFISTAQKRFSVFLGLWVGLGFYTYFGWPLVALLIAITLFFFPQNRQIGFSANFFRFSISAFLAVLPLLYSFFRQGFNQYLLGLFLFNHNLDNENHWSIFRCLCYCTSFFWKGWRENFAYNPWWGGFLNPIAGAFFFLGLITLWKFRNRPFVRWVFLALGVLFLPVLLANNTNWFHVLSLLPFFLGIGAVGFLDLLNRTRRTAGRFFLCLFLFFSLGLDGVNIYKTKKYLDQITSYDKNTKPVYDLLNQLYQERGIGIILTEWVPEPWIMKLNFDTIPFNALYQTDKILSQASWMGVLTNVNYKPFLDERFPGGKFYWLSQNTFPPDGGLMLWVIPTDSIHQNIWTHWRQAALTLTPFWEEYNDILPGHTYSDLVGILNRAYLDMKGDPFLESCYWDLLSNLTLNEKILLSDHLELRADQITATQMIPRSMLNEPSLRENINDLQCAVNRGYPSANLYYELGTLWIMAKNPSQARKCFHKALKAPLDLTYSTQSLTDISGEK